MSFDDFLKRVDHYSDSELVGFCIYYLDKEEGENYVTADDIYSTLASARTERLSHQSIGAYISQLKKRKFISDYEFGYRLTPDGINHFSTRISDADRSDRFDEAFIGPIPVQDSFYNDLIDDINAAYTNEIDDAVLVLSRKLLENLAIDLLRARYGLTDEKITLFYNKDRRQFHPFSKLLDNLEDNISDFVYFSERLDAKTIDDLRDFKQQGNAGAHSIELNPSESEMNYYQNELNELAGILTYVRKEVRASKES